VPSKAFRTAQPVAEELTFTLQGPYASFHAANAARPSPASIPRPGKAGPTIYGPVVASATPVKTTNWSSGDEMSGIRLSDKLVLGYYLFVLDIITRPPSFYAAPVVSGIVAITG
jgi:hypothetical protein